MQDFVDKNTETKAHCPSTNFMETVNNTGARGMTGVARRFFIGMGIFTVALMVFLGTAQY